MLVLEVRKKNFFFDIFTKHFISRHFYFWQILMKFFPAKFFLIYFLAFGKVFLGEWRRSPVAISKLLINFPAKFFIGQLFVSWCVDNFWFFLLTNSVQNFSRQKTYDLLEQIKEGLITKQMLEDFRTEAQIMKNINPHPNIIQVTIYPRNTPDWNFFLVIGSLHNKCWRTLLSYWILC